MLEQAWRRLRGEVRRTPGVVYSHQLYWSEARQAITPFQWSGNLRNVRMDTVPDAMRRQFERVEPGPEEQPYTFAERIGVIPVNPSRVRARQYYYPITDFALYDYDEASPEEDELVARWMAHVTRFNLMIPIAVVCGTAVLGAPLASAYRVPLLVAGAVSSVYVAAARAYVAAALPRQDLDDFIMAKELWYIKNVETYQLGLPRIPRGRETEYQSYVDGSNAAATGQLLPAELADALH